MIHIFEHKGVLLHVDYEPGEPPTFTCVRVMDAHYRPTGPDIQILLDDAFVLGDHTDADGCLEAETFLQRIVGEFDGQEASAPAADA